MDAAEPAFLPHVVGPPGTQRDYLGENHRVSDSAVICSGLVAKANRDADSARVSVRERRDLTQDDALLSRQSALIETGSAIRYRDFGRATLQNRRSNHHLII